MNFYLMSAVKVSFVKFHSDTSTQTSCSGPACSAIPLLIETCLKDMQTKYALKTHQRPIKNINARVLMW